MARSGPVIVAEDPALLTAVTYTEFTITPGSSTSNPGSTGTTLIRTNQVQSDSDIPGTTSITTTSNNQTYTTTINEIEEQNFINNVYNTSTGGVGSLNAQTGDLTLAAGSNVSVITSGSTITISAAGGLGSSGYSGYSGAAGSPGSTGVSGVSGYSGAGTPAGDDTEIQYNNSGTFGASAALTWNNASGRLSVEGTEEVGPIHESFTQTTPAQLTITITSGGSTNVTIVSGGSGFTNGQQIFIPGTSLGGVSPTNDRTLTITGTGGGGSIFSTSIDSDPAAVLGTYNFNPVSASVTTNIYYLSTGVSSLNVNSINLAQDYCTNFLLVITQGATPLVPNSFSIDGTNVPLLYPGGVPITGTASSTNVVNISVFRTGVSAYTALAQVVSFS